MATVARNLAHGQLPAASAALYTASVARVTITAFLLHNASAADRTWSLWRVPSGASATDANEVYANQPILIDKTEGADYLLGQTLEVGDAIHGVASAASSVTYSISGLVHA
jgi:hypothetical protein